MNSIMRIATTGSVRLGQGVDFLTGELLGNALNASAPEVAADSGAVTSGRFREVESIDRLSQDLRLSVSLSGRYLLASGSSSFELVEASQFNAYSTFIVGTVSLTEPIKSISDPVFREPAKALAADDRKAFRAAYGDGFVRAIIRGGQLQVVMRLTSENVATQKRLAATLQAELNGLVAGGQFRSQFEMSERNESTRSEFECALFQMGGRGNGISMVKNVEEVVERVGKFSEIVRQDPFAFEIEGAHYRTVPLPDSPPDWLLSAREEVLEDCLGWKLRWTAARNAISFAIAPANRAYFKELPSQEELLSMLALYTGELNRLMAHARKVCSLEVQPSFYAPEANLPAVNFLRPLEAEQKVYVPNLIGKNIDASKVQLLALGLKVHEERSPDTAPENDRLVFAQEPPAGSQVPKGSTVTVKYRYRLITDVWVGRR